MSRRLIVNADDYGRTPNVSRGILEAHRRGIADSTPAMIGLEGVEAHLAEALSCLDLGVGLRLGALG
jgi:predicted glycoside hydrolase/deacetylase ChbG (UPF0249 family)